MDLSFNQEEGHNIEVKRYFGNFAFDIIGEIGFGYHFHAQSTGSNQFIEAFEDSTRGMLTTTTRIMLKFFPFMWYIPIGAIAKSRRSKAVAENVLNEVCFFILKLVSLFLSTLLTQDSLFSSYCTVINEGTVIKVRNKLRSIRQP